ncbi:hypothetical protein CDIK_1376 [Cucumispora dikerogammari]|nr:hypothetical protein CDIK_1376 [Cucumispora dikerogammari]
MNIMNSLLQTTIQQTNNPSKTIQSLREGFDFLCYLQPFEFLTSNKKANIKFSKKRKNLTIEDFKLKPNKPANSILIPLFELKYKDKQSIKSGFEKLLECNKKLFKYRKIRGKKNNKKKEVWFKLDEIIVSDIIYPTSERLFVLENPQTKTLFVYSLLILGDNIKLFVTDTEEPKIMYNDKIISRFSIRFNDLSHFNIIRLLAKIRLKWQEYVFIFPSQKNEPFFSVELHSPTKQYALFGIKNSNRYINISCLMGNCNFLLFKDFLIPKTKNINLKAYV